MNTEERKRDYRRFINAVEPWRRDEFFRVKNYRYIIVWQSRTLGSFTEGVNKIEEIESLLDEYSKTGFRYQIARVLDRTQEMSVGYLSESIIRRYPRFRTIPRIGINPVDVNTKEKPSETRRPLFGYGDLTDL